jgi:hypothetical protein
MSKIADYPRTVQIISEPTVAQELHELNRQIQDHEMSSTEALARAFILGVNETLHAVQEREAAAYRDRVVAVTRPPSPIVAAVRTAQSFGRAPSDEAIEAWNYVLAIADSDDLIRRATGIVARMTTALVAAEGRAIARIDRAELDRQRLQRRRAKNREKYLRRLGRPPGPSRSSRPAAVPDRRRRDRRLRNEDRRGATVVDRV